jgi:integrase
LTDGAAVLTRRGALAGELVSPAAELVELFSGTLERDTTRATYRSACGRFVAWLRDRHGPAVGPAALTLDELAAYQRELARERSPFTVRKERAALNSFLRFLLEQELVDQRQARLALAVQGPRPKDVDGRRPIAALTERQYERLVGEGERLAASEPLRGWRDVTIVRLLGECGLRAEELAGLGRRDLRPVRHGAKRRELHVRHGKGARIRSVPISGEALRALRRWDRFRVEKVGGPPGSAIEPERWPLV